MKQLDQYHIGRELQSPPLSHPPEKCVPYRAKIVKVILERKETPPEGIKTGKRIIY